MNNIANITYDKLHSKLMKAKISVLIAWICMVINLSEQEGYTVKKDSLQSDIQSWRAATRNPVESLRYE